MRGNRSASFTTDGTRSSARPIAGGACPTTETTSAPNTAIPIANVTARLTPRAIRKRSVRKAIGRSIAIATSTARAIQTNTAALRTSANHARVITAITAAPQMIP